MLFNSFPFLLAFLPGALLLHWAVERFRPDWRLHALAVLSLIFYGYWDWRFVPLLVASILLNWLVVEVFHARRWGVLILLAIVGNLIVLGVFKYLGFFTGLAGMLIGFNAPKFELALPLGISFFTFHHVMYLVDLRAGLAPRYDLTRYALYIAFFPQVLSGPLVRWSELMHQLDELPHRRHDAAEHFARGIVVLTIGLAKKVLLADPLAEYANPIFQAAASGRAITVAEAWQGTLSFTFQIYFDFSGYTDMALGIALLFGIVLPQNFDVPYRAMSLQEFWRRWHMTLSRFLRDYLYIPLGGNQRGRALQVLALLVTMLLGGLWHGAGLTFLAWGAVHGVGLVVVLLWRGTGLIMPAALAWGLTFLFVVLTWVPFRSTSFEAAWRMYEGMFGCAPLGIVAGPAWLLIAVAASISIIGPTAWRAAHRMPLSIYSAIAVATIMVAVLFKIGDDRNFNFIYFQF